MKAHTRSHNSFRERKERTIVYHLKVERIIRNSIPTFSLENIPLNDRQTMAGICSGDIGKLLWDTSDNPAQLIDNIQLLQPTSADELAIAYAISQIGPVQTGITKRYLERLPLRLGRCDSEIFEDIICSTRRVIVYDEQVMEIAKRIAGLSSAQAYAMTIALKHEKDLGYWEKEFSKSTHLASAGTKTRIGTFRLISHYARGTFSQQIANETCRLVYKTRYLSAHFIDEAIMGLDAAKETASGER